MEFKVVLIGDSDVGKTSILNMLTDKEFDTDLMPTIQPALKRKKIQIPSGEMIILNIWDTAGQEKYRSLTKQFLRGVDAAVAVCSLVNEQSIIHVPFWIDYLDKEGYKPVIVIAANKKDLLGSNYDKMNQVIDSFNDKSFSDVFTVSALTNEGISDVFDCVAQRCFENAIIHSKDTNVNDIDNEKINIVSTQKRKCC